MNKSVLLCFLLMIFTGVKAQISNAEKIAGEWSGALSIQNTKLRIVFHFKSENGIISATLDSPDQGAKGIPVKEVKVTRDSILVDVASVTGKYRAVFTSDTSMQGMWYQGGMNRPLNIYKKGKEVVRPLADVSHLKYDAIDVKIKNESAGIILAGTLTLPKGGKKCPAVVLVSGSGPQNRNEELMGQKPFYRIADYLSSRGIAVLRYDDRGISESTGNFHTATTHDFAIDADAAFQFLIKQPGIDPKKSGMIGHSEGAMIAPIIASQNKELAFLVLLAGPGITGKEILLTQTEAILKAQGLKADTIQQIVQLNDEIYSLVVSQPNDSIALHQIMEIISKRNFPAEAKNMIQRGVPSMLSPWFKGFISFDPSLYLSKVNCPVLALNGSKDLQVIPRENLTGIEKGLEQAKNKKYEIIELPGYNHLFQQSETGKMSEYSNTDKPAMDDKVLEMISAWIKKL